MEEELGLIGASAEDTEAELIRKICDTELLAGNENLILCFSAQHQIFVKYKLFHHPLNTVLHVDVNIIVSFIY